LDSFIASMMNKSINFFEKNIAEVVYANVLYLNEPIFHHCYINGLERKLECLIILVLAYCSAFQSFS